MNTVLCLPLVMVALSACSQGETPGGDNTAQKYAETVVGVVSGQ